MARFLQDYSAPLAQAQIQDGSRVVGWDVSRPAAVTGSNDEAGFSFSISTVFKDGKSCPTNLNELNVLNQHRKVTMTRMQEVVVLVGTLPEVKP